MVAKKGKEKVKEEDMFVHRAMQPLMLRLIGIGDTFISEVFQEEPAESLRERMARHSWAFINQAKKRISVRVLSQAALDLADYRGRCY